MLGTREYTLCSTFRANAHNSSCQIVLFVYKISFCTRTKSVVHVVRCTLRISMKDSDHHYQPDV